jgi:2-keto-4-pentenoate hydratase/2-oxohepta-3-ene-1,7-dioic acid hydratase in catechol pathway
VPWRSLEQGPRRACVGGTDCFELEKSGNCKSALKCDNGELGAMICSLQSLVAFACRFFQLKRGTMYASDSGAKRDRRDGDVERWRTDKRGCETVGTYSLKIVLMGRAQVCPK